MIYLIFIITQGDLFLHCKFKITDYGIDRDNKDQKY